jgi:PAS domain S-box-containing protein
VYHQVLELIQEALGSSQGFFGYINEEGHLVCPTMSSGVWEQCDIEDKASVFPREEWGGLWGRSLQEKRAFHQNSGLNPPEGHIAVDNSLTVPIIHHDQVIGLFALANKKGGYTAEDQRLLEMLASYVSPILHARLEQDRMENHRQSDEAERRRLVAAIEQAAESIFVTDVNGTIQYINPAFEVMSGYSRREAVGQNPRILKSGRHKETFYREMWSTILSGQTWRGRMTDRRKNGSHYEKEIVISPVRDEKGDIINFVSVSRDVTYEVELESQLRQAQKMEAVGTLAGGIAHDFNNILHAILGYNKLAMEDVPRQGETWSCLLEVKQAAERARDLVKQILTFSRQSEQERKPLSLAPVTKETMKLLRRSIPTTIEIRQKIDSSCPLVLADPSQMCQVIMNLCTNAYQSMQEQGGILEITLNEKYLEQGLSSEYSGLSPGRYVMLEVRDTGSGMDRLTADRAFEPYFTTKEAGEGTGLGLATVHGIVQAHGGAIDLETQPDRGTAVRVFFPICKSLVEPAASPVESEYPLAVGTERILLVDDEESIVKLGRRLLERLGYEVETYTSSVKAAEAFESVPGDYDLVITDLTMPKMNGFDLARFMLEIRPDIPIIMCTGFSEAANKEKVVQVGIREYILKPIVLEELSRAIRSLLDQPVMERS